MTVERPTIYRPSAAGCAAITWRDGKPDGTCAHEPEHVGWLWYEHPKPAHWTPAFFCPAHVEAAANVRGLDDRLRTILAERRAEAQRWERVREENRARAWG